MLERLISHIDGDAVFFGALAVVSFWFCIQICWSVVGKRWYSVTLRVLGALALFAFGVVMIFFTAFGG